MKRQAQEVLRVFWEGEEVPGLTFYGLRRRGHSDTPVFPADAWDSLADHRRSHLHGDLWEVIVWDVRVARWPSAEKFHQVVRQTLEALLVGSCSVAWVGREGFFVDPPDLFLPEFMSEGVLAALSRETGFRIAVALDEPMQFLLDDELQELREAGGGLALLS